MLTSWGEGVFERQHAEPAAVPHAEHPRPTLERADWMPLNGLWTLRIPLESARSVSLPILVPFPAGSTLSGVKDVPPKIIYTRELTIPPAWKGKRILLHFEAVDWETTVTLNGRVLGMHHGGYDPFTFDITEALAARAEGRSSDTLEVAVFDPTQHGEQMLGKQSTEPSGIWYSPTNGIWQSVWLEAVPVTHVRSLDVETDTETGAVSVRLDLAEPKPHQFVAMAVRSAGKEVARLYAGCNGPFRLTIPRDSLILWNPDTPHLYDIEVRIMQGETVIDSVKSYFGLRTIATIPGPDGRMRVHLNGKPVFLLGVIDQGYWPDGRYTAPSDAAIESDIRTVKLLGFNTIRKHAKVEPERWYYWCDRIGLLVWQDIPGAANRTADSQEGFERELRAVVRARRSHPSLIVWTLFNEGRGQHRTEKYVELLRMLDPERLIDNASGWNDAGLGDLLDGHKFPGPEMPKDPDPHRAAVLGSYGGITLLVAEHLWTTQTWGYQHVADSEKLLGVFETLQRELAALIPQGLAGAAFHQLTDVESECNGLITYDRRRIKVPPESVRKINESLRDD